MHPRHVFPGLMTLVALSGFPNAESRSAESALSKKFGIFCMVI
jgi:hypothetical protein